MLRYRIIPVLLLKNSGLIKTTRFKHPVYVGDPINAVKIFNEKEVDELIILDTTATLEKKEINYKRIEEIVSEAFMPLGYGGGIQRMDQIEQLFKIGVEKIILNTSALVNPNLVKTASSVFGNQSIIAAIDVKKDFFGNYRIYTHSGTVKQSPDLLETIKELENLGTGEIIINSIDKDGTMSGYDVSLVEQVSKNTSVPVVACGGAGTIHHFSEVIHAGASAVAAGAMFVFHGKHRAVLISYPRYQELEKLMNTV
jgi:imidazole glycerol-phosphate synthase subunit HisF